LINCKSDFLFWRIDDINKTHILIIHS
jgi:hypothetical protein